MTSEREWVQLSAYLDGELNPNERSQVEQRLATDPEARKALQALERTQTLIATTMEDVDLTAAVRERVETMEPGNNAGGRRYLVPAVAAAVVLFAALAGISWLGEGVRPQVEPVAPVAESPEAAPRVDETPRVAAPEPPPTPAAPAPSETEPPSEVMMADSPPVDAFFELPEANVPYVLLAVDTAVFPPFAFVRPGRDESVLRIAEGDAMPDGAPLAWAGTDGVILGSQGEWRRIDAPDDSTDTLTGWWQLGVYLNDRHDTTAVVRVTETSDGRFLFPYRDRNLQGQRTGTRLEVAAPGDGAAWTGSTTAGLTRIDLSGTANDESVTIRAERMTQLERAQHAYRESLRGQTVRLAESILQQLTGLLRSTDEPLPNGPDALIRLVAERSQSDADLLDRTLVYYEPIATPPGPVPSLPAEAAGDPDALHRFELEMTAAYGLDAPVSVPILELSHEEIGDRVGLSINPGGDLTLWQRRDASTGEQGDDMLSQLNLRRLGAGMNAFQREFDGLTPAGWWGLYAHLGNSSQLDLTHPGDEPGTLSYEILLPATDVTAYLEGLLGPDGLEPREELQRLLADLPLIAENRAFGEPQGRHVVFADGHSDWMTEQDYQRLIREWFR